MGSPAQVGPSTQLLAECLLHCHGQKGTGFPGSCVNLGTNNILMPCQSSLSMSIKQENRHHDLDKSQPQTKVYSCHIRLTESQQEQSRAQLSEQLCLPSGHTNELTRGPVFQAAHPGLTFCATQRADCGCQENAVVEGMMTLAAAMCILTSLPGRGFVVTLAS